MVGVVGQDPAASFVTDIVEDELAYTMENLGLPPAAMRRRVEDTLDLLGLHELRDRPLRTFGRPAAAGGHRCGAHRLAAGAGARRADVGPRPGGRRGGARLTHPPGPRPRDDRAGGRTPPGAGHPLCRLGSSWFRRWRARWSSVRPPTSWPTPRSRPHRRVWPGWPAGRRSRCRSGTPDDWPAAPCGTGRADSHADPTLLLPAQPPVSAWSRGRGRTTRCPGA